MKSIYIIQSQKDDSTYVGNSSDVTTRVKHHNLGWCKTTRNRTLWKLVCDFRFNDNQTAYNFERYLKTGSGRAFLNKRFLK